VVALPLFSVQALQEALPGPHEEARGGPVSPGGHAAGCPGPLPHGRGAAARRQRLPVAGR